MLGFKKGQNKELCGRMPLHYPADRVYLHGDTDEDVESAIDELATKSIGDLKDYLQTGFSANAGQFQFFKRGKTATIVSNGVVPSNTGNGQVMAVLPNELAGAMLTFAIEVGPTGVSQGLIFVSGNTIYANVTTAAPMYFSLVYQIYDFPS